MRSETTLGVAAAQTISVRGAIDANIVQHCALAQRAAQEGADVVVFPELSLTGYELDLAPSLAFVDSDPRLSPLQRVARSCGLTLIVGAPVRLQSGLHIGAFIVGPDERIQIYTKQHVWGDEQEVFVPGFLDPLLLFGEERAACAICADTSHAGHPEAAAKRGATLYLAGVFFDPESYPASSGRLEGYSRAHGMGVVMANGGGDATNFEAAGGSSIWSEEGERVVQLEGPGLGLVIGRRLEGRWVGQAVRL